MSKRKRDDGSGRVCGSGVKRPTLAFTSHFHSSHRERPRSFVAPGPQTDDTPNILAVILGLAVAQDPNYRSNYQDDDRQNAATDGRRGTTTTPIPILHWNKQQEHDGTYKTSYETGNNIIAEESGYIKTVGEGAEQGEALVQQGSYSYMSPEGQLITIHYTADETGFHASGDHIPTPPPVSEEIQKGLDLIFAGIRQQEEAEAREAASKNQQQPLSQQIDRRDDYDKKFRQ
ncbi:hypothetical protein HZH68_003058 [Vespula germanica]|uniref:Uncharacterized protein n=1 Tax=Vespula germanica TaxID=30212 RepID=A0A834U2E5_VESGE|nr:hypothetical protein HZH68_003058 [Vespula germanica]